MMRNLPLSLREELKQKFFISHLKIIKKIKKNMGKFYHTIFKRRAPAQELGRKEQSSSDNQDSEKTNPSNP
jgi:hypothetical protein